MKYMKMMAAAVFLLTGATQAHPAPTKQTHPVQTTSPTKQDGRDGHRGVKGVNDGAGEKGEDGKNGGNGGRGGDGADVQGVMADTDNEHALTVEYARTIHKQIGCKLVQFAKRVYTENDFAKRRAYLQKNWPKPF